MINRFEWAFGRYLLAILFIAGTAQKAINPDPAQELLVGFGLPEWLVWPALVFNALAASLLIAGKFLRAIGWALALYCFVTSVFHFVPSDPWQMSIFVKNWALAGGCLILSAASVSRT
ncbi:DoxX family protein [Roseovarius amoyensis]|uniref:DoxX family protein n=1 Tax=Roseovarius amoyensis TaxID=2211448 RepID=UPI000DBE11AA|nr:DoxX family membrane protein [Roseovarius amoyensis]